VGLLESIRTSVAEIWSHKLRSILTLAGVVLGTTSLVVMVSVIGGVALAVQKGLSDLGFDGVVFASSQRPTDRIEQKKAGYSRGLRRADLGTIERGQELIEGAAPAVSLRETIRINGRSLQAAVEGITPAYGVVRNRSVEEGRFIVSRDLDDVTTVCVIGQQLKLDAFGAEKALGREVLIRSLRFKIVGILPMMGTSQVGSGEMRRQNSGLYIPLSTAQKHFTGGDVVHYYAFKVGGDDQLTDGQKEIEALLRRSHRGISDFRIMNIGEEILRVRKEVDQLIVNWRVILASIAGISLLIGGIGIFSVMQIAISERLYEIGLRKAIGATDGAIFVQFLIESVSLSLVGGLTGSALGYVITIAAGTAFEDGLTVSPLGLILAAAFAIVIGLSAGLYPALRASRLHPVEAIRGA
jgi:putative ABC transport system permease protein